MGCTGSFQLDDLTLYDSARRGRWLRLEFEHGRIMGDTWSERFDVLGFLHRLWPGGVGAGTDAVDPSAVPLPECEVGRV